MRAPNDSKNFCPLLPTTLIDMRAPGGFLRGALGGPVGVKKLNIKPSMAIFVNRSLARNANKFSRSIFRGLFSNFEFFFDEF